MSIFIPLEEVILAFDWRESGKQNMEEINKTDGDACFLQTLCRSGYSYLLPHNNVRSKNSKRHRKYVQVNPLSAVR